MELAITFLLIVVMFLLFVIGLQTYTTGGTIVTGAMMIFVCFLYKFLVM